MACLFFILLLLLAALGGAVPTTDAPHGGEPGPRRDASGDRGPSSQLALNQLFERT